MAWLLDLDGMGHWGSIVTFLGLLSAFRFDILHIGNTENVISIRAGHAYAKYADYAHMRNMRMRIENLIHIFHIQREKNESF